MQVRLHELLTHVLAAIHNSCQAVNGKSVEFWPLMALTQLIDICIYADFATFDVAEDAVMPGEANLGNAHTWKIFGWRVMPEHKLKAYLAQYKPLPCFATELEARLKIAKLSWR